jgi:hypothetical protein
MKGVIARKDAVDVNESLNLSSLMFYGSHVNIGFSTLNLGDQAAARKSKMQKINVGKTV